MPVFAEQKETSTSVLDRRLSVSELQQQQQQQQQQGASSDRLLASKEELLNSGSNGAAQQEVEAQIKTQQQQEQLQYEQQQQQQQQSPPSSTAMPTASASASEEPSISAPQEETMIFFDWDDTLLSSTFLASHGYRLDTDLDNKEGFVELMLPELKQLEACVVNVLSEALQRGRVHIITNAEHGWVELSAQKFIPGVLPYLQQVTVISARSTYEHMFPEAPLKWKFSAFQDRLSAFFALEGVTRNILSFGDSHVEREAVRTVTRGVENTKTKSIKFTESPTIDQLRKQLELVTSHFHYLHTHEGDLDLMLKMSPVPADNNGSA